MRASWYQKPILTTVLIATLAGAEVAEFSMPGDLEFEEALQGPLSPRFFLQSIDFSTTPDGIRPLEPQEIVSVPTIPSVIAGLDSLIVALGQEDKATALTVARTRLGWSAAQLAALNAYFDICNVFGRDVSRFNITALQDANVGGVTIRQGDVLVERLQDLPKSPALVAELLAAGITQAAVLVNVADSFPKPTTDAPPDSVLNKLNKNVKLTTLAFWEKPLEKARRFELEPAQMFDGSAETGFARIDQPDADVVQKFRIWIDLDRYFPISIVRFHNLPNDGFNLKAFTLYSGVPDTEDFPAGFNFDRAGNLGFPRFINVANTFPEFVILNRAPVNTLDTVAVVLDPPTRLRYLRLDIDTDLDFTLSEIQAFANGFMPNATYITRPLTLPDTARATLGRIFWDEEVVGDSSKSRAIVSIQSGLDTEPDIFFRFNDFNDEVEWRATGARVVDRRRGSLTFGDSLDLNDQLLRNNVRAIFSALSDAERAAVRTTRAEYIATPANARGRIVPELQFWSGMQPARNRQVTPAPGGRPFFQIRVDLLSDDPTAGRIVRNLRFEYDTQRSANELRAEIAPAVGVKAGIDTLFTLAMQAELTPESGGFNRLQVSTPARVTNVTSVLLHRTDGTSVTLLRGPDGQAPETGQFTVSQVRDNFFVVSLPTVSPPSAGQDTTLVRLRFTARVIDFNTTFTANIFLDTLGQRDRTEYSAIGLLALRETEAGTDTVGLVLPQGASEPASGQSIVDFLAESQLSDRNSLIVTADISGLSSGLLDNVKLSPNPFTPNDDNINDELIVSFDVLRLISPGSVRVEVYDLSGRRVRSLQDNQLKSGGYSTGWDGKDDRENLVPPGLYILRVKVDGDDQDSAVTQVVSVAY